MSGFDQVPYRPLSAAEEASIFVDNPDPRCPVALVLDKSGSMSGAPIRELNAGLKVLRDELQGDALAARRVELAIVSFGPVTVDSAFGTADTFNPPVLHASGETPMGAALTTALDLLEERKRSYRSNGITYFRPWLFLITDGGPTDSVMEAAHRIRAAEAAKSLAAFGIGVQGADMARLAQIVVRQPLSLNGLDFKGLFKWLSASLATVSASAPGAAVALPPPSGWATV